MYIFIDSKNMLLRRKEIKIIRMKETEKIRVIVYDLFKKVRRNSILLNSL